MMRFAIGAACLVISAWSVGVPAAGVMASAQHVSADTVKSRALGNSFLTPSGNIGCISYSGALRCDIRQKNWHVNFGGRPPCLEGIRGDSLEMDATGRPQWICHGDTALVPLGQRGVLAYGKTWHWGSFACVSRITGLTCVNRASRGFFLSRQTYQVF